MKNTDSKNHQQGNKNKKGCRTPIFIFLSLFILPGLGFGLFTTGQTVLLQNWVEVEATIDSTFYKAKSVKRIEKRKITRPSSYTVSQTRAKYTYQWQGEIFQSDQIAIWQRSTNEKERNEELKKVLDKAKTVRAFVNSNNPEEAVLVRSIHNGIIFFYLSAFSCFFAFGALSGLIIKYPSHKFGIICLLLLIILYAWYFGMGGIYLVNYIEVLS